MDIMQMIDAGAQFKVELTSQDLRKFAEGLIAMAQQAKEEELLRQAEHDHSEEWISAADVCKMCHCCNTTLYGWEKRGYLVPAKIGGRKFYALSDVRKILSRRGTDPSMK
jgi:hypothetical protein